MTDYIDREALLKAIRKVGGSPLIEWDTVGVVSLVANQPAADVAPVRRGRWLDGVEGSMLRICSLCGFTAGAPSHRFCPACGAKMEVDYEN